MNKLYVTLFTLISGLFGLEAQTFKVDTLVYHGDIDQYINFVLLGDGYTDTEQAKFIQSSKSFIAELTSETPWKNYAPYINFFAIRVISAESGISHPKNASDCNTEPTFQSKSVNSYLGSTFDACGIHRLVVPQFDNIIGKILLNNFPKYDQVLIIANSPYYGGSGGTYATSTTNVSSNQISLHEIGHSFAHLSDEYYAGDVYAGESPNMTKTSSTSNVKWKNWIGTNSVGIYQHCCGGNSSLWYRPHQSCKMRYLGNSFCPVCTETIIESIHQLVNPIASYTPSNSSAIIYNNNNQIFKLTELIQPEPKSLKTRWKLNDSTLMDNIDSIELNKLKLKPGTNKLLVTVEDTTTFLRKDNHSSIHLYSVSWDIINNDSNVSIGSINKTGIHIHSYPNPSNQILHVELKTNVNSVIIFELYSTEAKLMHRSTSVNTSREITKQIDISTLTSGTYTLLVWVNGVRYSSEIIIQH